MGGGDTEFELAREGDTVRVNTDPYDYDSASPPNIVVHALRENKRPIGYAPWPGEPKRKRKKKKEKK